MRKKIILLGLIILIVGSLLVGLSQVADVHEASKKTEILANVEYPKPNGVRVASVLVNLTAAQNFTVEPPVPSEAATSVTGTQVFVDIVDPNGEATENYFDYKADSSTGRWGATAQGWNGKAIANVTGEYNISASVDPPLFQLMKLTVSTTSITPGYTEYPYSILTYPAILITAGGVVIIVLGVAMGSRQRTRRARLQKAP